MKLIQKITKKDGEVQDREKIHRFLDKVLDSLPDGTIQLELRSTDRTTAQNNYMWVVYTIIAQALGSTPNDIHNYCKEEFLPSREFFVLTRRKQVSSTTYLSKDEMVAYLDKIILWASDNGIVIPDIEEYKHSFTN